MKFSLPADVLNEAMSTVAPLSKGQGITNCILIEAGVDGVTFTAGDGDTFVTLTREADVERVGSVATPARTIAKASSKLRGTVTLTEDDDGALGVDTKSSRLTLPTAPTVEYPKLSWPDGEPVDLTEWWGDLAKIAYAADSEKSPNAWWYSITFSDGRATAFGGIRLAYCPAPGDLEGIVLRSSFYYAHRTLGDEVTMTLSSQFVRFAGDGIAILSRVPMANVKPLPIDFETPHKVTVNRKELLEALGLVEVVKDSIATPVRIDVSECEMRMQANSPDIGEVACGLEAEGELPYPTGFTSSHVRDVLTRMDGETVTFGFSAEPNKPIRVIEGDVTHILNPNREAVKRNPTPTGESE